MTKKTGIQPRPRKPGKRVILATPCPTCGVRAGVPCMNLSDQKMPRAVMQEYLRAGYDTEPFAAPQPHAARIALAASRTTSGRPSNG